MKKLYLTIIAAALVSCAPCDAMHIHRAYPTSSWKKPTTIVGALGLLTVGVYTAYKYRTQLHSQAKKGFNWLGRICKFTDSQSLLRKAQIAPVAVDRHNDQTDLMQGSQGRIRQLEAENKGFVNQIAYLYDENNRLRNNAPAHDNNFIAPANNLLYRKLPGQQEVQALTTYQDCTTCLKAVENERNQANELNRQLQENANASDATIQNLQGRNEELNRQLQEADHEGFLTLRTENTLLRNRVAELSRLNDGRPEEKQSTLSQGHKLSDTAPASASREEVAALRAAALGSTTKL